MESGFSGVRCQNCRSWETLNEDSPQSTWTQGGLIVERRVTLQGKQAGKKMGVKKMKSGIQFFAAHLFAS
jgi:hypothetical protein